MIKSQDDKGVEKVRIREALGNTLDSPGIAFKLADIFSNFDLLVSPNFFIPHINKIFVSEKDEMLFRHF